MPATTSDTSTDERKALNQKGNGNGILIRNLLACEKRERKWKIVTVKFGKAFRGVKIIFTKRNDKFSDLWS